MKNLRRDFKKVKNYTVRNRVAFECVLYCGGREYLSFLRINKTNMQQLKGKEALYGWLKCDVLKRKDKQFANEMCWEELEDAVLAQIECNKFNEPKQFELFETNQFKKKKNENYY